MSQQYDLFGEAPPAAVEERAPVAVVPEPAAAPVAVVPAPAPQVERVTPWTLCGRGQALGFDVAPIDYMEAWRDFPHILQGEETLLHCAAVAEALVRGDLAVGQLVSWRRPLPAGTEGAVAVVHRRIIDLRCDASRPPEWGRSCCVPIETEHGPLTLRYTAGAPMLVGDEFPPPAKRRGYDQLMLSDSSGEVGFFAGRDLREEDGSLVEVAAALWPQRQVRKELQEAASQTLLEQAEAAEARLAEKSRLAQLAAVQGAL